MKKIIFLSLLLSTVACMAQAQVLLSHNAHLSFFSQAPLEDIKGESEVGMAALNIETGDIVFKVKNNSFQFKKKLMKDHFNENYMESDQYPFSEFKGKVENSALLKKDGTYSVRVSGILQIHGVTKKYSTSVKMVVSNGNITATCSFRVKTADHHIKIPTVVIRNIAEVLDVTVLAIFKPNNS